MSGNLIGALGFTYLGKAIGSSTLRSLILSRCGMRIFSLRVLVGGICSNITLRSVDFSHNNLSGGNSPKLMNVLFSTNKTLDTLNFNDCLLGESYII